MSDSDIDKENIPYPTNPGSSGLQKQEQQATAVNTSAPFAQNHLATAIEGIAASSTRALGGEVGSAMVAAATRQLVSDNEQLRAENRDLRSRYDTQRNDLEDSRTKAAVLRERLSAEGRNRHLRNLSITIGVGLFGIGLNMARTEIDAASIGAMVVGVVLGLLGWLTGPRGDAE